MPWRNGEDDLVAEERLEDHPAVAPRRADDPEFQLALGDPRTSVEKRSTNESLGLGWGAATRRC